MTPPEAYCKPDGDRVHLLVAPAIRTVVTEAAELVRQAAELAHAAERFDQRSRRYVAANARDALKATFELWRSIDDWVNATPRR